MSKFAMYGKMTAQPGKRDELARLLLESEAALQEMEGCLLYILNESEDEPDVLWVTELWESAEAHDASLRNEKVLALIQRCRPLIAGVSSVPVRPIGGKGLS